MDAELRNMVMAFRVTELQNLLGQFGKNRNGRKNELQARALDLMKARDATVVARIRELHRSIQLSLNQPLPASAGITHPQLFSSGPMTGRMFGSPAFSNSGDKVLQGRNIYANSTYNGTSSQMPGLQVINNRLPICPDVRMQRLPFYDIQAELTRPTSLLGVTNGRVQDANFTFFLTPSQAADIASSKEYNSSGYSEHKIQYSTQVQMRFCALDTTSPQDDLFPPSINIKVNQRNVPLPHPIPSNRPGVEAKRPSRPLNVTNYVKVSPTVTNHVNVTWANDMSGRDYVISIALVKKLCSQDLLSRLKTKGPRPADYTRGMIKELVRKDDADCIATTSFKVSVACPLGKCRMSLPCRASTCKHLQCFDANLYLQMNEKKPVWSCPVCDKFTAFDDLAVDGYFQEVINKLGNSGNGMNDIEVLPDGTWRPLTVKKEPEEPPAKKMKHSDDANETICLDDDDVICEDEISAKKPQAEKETPKRPSEIIDLTTSSDEEESKEDNASHTSSKNSKSDDSEEEVIKPRTRRKKPQFMIDESSSSSSSSDDGSGSDRVAKKSTPAQQSNTRASTPDCIILDSPTPSPESRQETESCQRNEVTEKTTLSETAATTISSTFTSGYNSGDSPIGSYPMGFGPGLLPPVSSCSGLMPLGLPETSFGNPNPFLSYDRPAWESTATFPSTSDFSTLDYPSMDYFNQGSYNNSRPAPGGGGPGGFGMGRW